MSNLRLTICALAAIALLACAATAAADGGPPSVAALGASHVTTSGAHLHSGVNPNGRSTFYYFEYGTSTA